MTHLLRRLAGALSSCRVKVYSCCAPGMTITRDITIKGDMKKRHDHKRRYKSNINI